MKVFVENQPKHSLMSIIIFNTPEIGEKVHENITKLGEISDLFFVFGKGSRGINPRRFTTLYEGCSWMKEDNLIEAFLTSVDYSKHIFSCHTGYLLTTVEGLQRNLDGKEITRIHALGNALPIVKIERKSLEEMRSLYVVEETGFLWWKKENRLNQYSTYRTPSWCIYFKALPLCADKNSAWTKTFDSSNVLEYFVNTVRRSGLGNLNETCDDTEGKE